MGDRKERQVSFAGGQLSRRLWGRTDLDQYKAGARTLKNFIVSPEGTLVARTGTQRIKQLIVDSTISYRLVPYIIDKDESYLFVFRGEVSGGIRYVNLYVLKESSSDPAYDNFNIDYVESYVTVCKGADENEDFVVVMTQRGREVAFGTRGAGADSSLTAMKFLKTNEDGDFSEVYASSENPWYTPELTRAAQGVGLQYARVRFKDADEFAQQTNEDTTHPYRHWEWAYSVVVEDSDGNVFETAPYIIERYHIVGTGLDSAPTTLEPLNSDEQAVYADQIRTIWTPLEKGDSVTLTGADAGYYQIACTVVTNRLYRGRDGQFGFVAQSDSNYIDDDGATPDFSNPPRSKYPPFDYGYVPEDICHFEGRLLVVQGSAAGPFAIYGSAIEDYRNFDEVLLADDADSFKLILVSKRNEKPLWLVPGRNLLVFTTDGEWVVSGSGENEAITPTAAMARPISKNGADKAVRPVESGDEVIYVTSNGSVPLALGFTERGYVNRDLSIFNRDIFRNRSIISMAWAQYPFQLLWVVLDNGQLFSCTYIPSIGMAAWAEHEITGVDKVIEVAVKPEQGESAVYLIVERNENYYLERFAYSEYADVRYAVHLDESVTYNGHMVSDVTRTVDLGERVSPLEGEIFTLNLTTPSTQIVDEDLSTGRFGSYLKVDNPEDWRESFIMYVKTDNGDNTYEVQAWSGDVPSWFSDSDTLEEYWVCAFSVSGLSTGLYGLTATVVADGCVYENVAVQHGTASIEQFGVPAGIIHAGRPYNCDFESLDTAQDRDREKIVDRIYTELDYARGGSVGVDFDNLVSIQDRKTTDDYDPLQLERREVETVVPSQWGTRGRVAFRQADPCPVTVVGITREYKLGK